MTNHSRNDSHLGNTNKKDSSAVINTVHDIESVQAELMKFQKMLSLGVPKPAVIQKMTIAGLNPELLDNKDASPYLHVVRKPLSFASPSLSKTMALLESTGKKSFSITLEDLRNVKLRSAVKMNTLRSRNAHGPEGPARGGGSHAIDLDAILNVKLKKTVVSDKEDSSLHSNKGGFNFNLKKSDIDRSPGGTFSPLSI